MFRKNNLLYTKSLLKNSIGLLRFYMKKSRGVPSTSLNLKEALCEKIPLHYDLVREFREQHGTSLASQIKCDDIFGGLSANKLLIKETSEIHPEFGITYRGLTIPEVVNLLPHRGHFPSPESIFWLLLTGDIPTNIQTASLIADWTNRRDKLKKTWLNDDKTFFQSIPIRVSPIKRLCTFLTILNSTGNQKRNGFKESLMNHTNWENTYEDSMDLLACFPEILGLVKSPKEFKTFPCEGDWVDCLLGSLKTSSRSFENENNSIGDFLRLFVTLNADENGVPSSHASQILGSCQKDVNKALAVAFLAISNEPNTGNLLQCVNFQEKIERLLGVSPKEEILRGLIKAFIEIPNGLPGYNRNLAVGDLRYKILEEFASEACPRDPNVQMSMEISRIVRLISNVDNVKLTPEINSLAPAVFKYHGLYDMEFNQALVCMSRALGSVASIIWNSIMNLPPPNPKSSSTRTWIESFRNQNGKNPPLQKTTIIGLIK